jgi:hypothetical protein
MTERNAVCRELMTEVLRIDYDVRTRRGRVFMAEGCCVDMTGTIRLFKRIDPQVKAIDTFAGELPDTCYRREHDDHWYSVGR